MSGSPESGGSYQSSSTDLAQTYRTPFSRNYSCSSTRRENRITYNWHARGYESIAPHPSYKLHREQDIPRAKEYPNCSKAQKTILDSARQPRSESKGKRKVASEKVDCNEGPKDPNTYPSGGIYAWLLKGVPSRVMRDEWGQDQLSNPETASVSTFQSSIFDSNYVENTSMNGKENDEALDTDLSVHPAPANPISVLPCEWVGYGACDQVFDPSAVGDWIKHIVSVHLRGNLPTKSVCWYCDNFVFCSDRYHDPRASFERRMRHIRDHIVKDRTTIHDMRPDYYLVDHAYKHNLISTVVYRLIQRYSEISKPHHVHPFDFTPPEAERENELTNVEILDQSREDRIRRRRIRRCKEEGVQQPGQTKENLKTQPFSCSQAPEVGPQLKPTKFSLYDVEQTKAGAHVCNKPGQSNIIGLDAPDCSFSKPALAVGKIEQHPKPGENILSNLPNSKPSLVSMYAGSGLPTHRTYARRSIRKTASNVCGNYIGKQPMITYGPLENHRVEKASRSCSEVPIGIPSNLKEILCKREQREKGGQSRIFEMVILRIRVRLSKGLSGLHRLFWPKRPPHLTRVSWACRCGQPLYIDVHPTERQAAIEYAQQASGADSSIVVSETARGGRSPTQTSSSISTSTTQIGAGVSDVTAPTYAPFQPSTIFTPPVLPKGTKRYLLLCVKTGYYEIKLEHIDLTNISLDVSLFSRIRETYESMRGPRMKNIFMAPKTVEYVKFELVRRSKTGECVGNYERNSIPSQTEVAKMEYTFSPCPPRVGTMPIQPHLFMHSFLNPGDHLGELALLQLPKKVGRKLKCVRQPLDPFDVPYGWGIYIVEGLNTLLVSLLLIVILALVTLMVILWSQLKSDVQGGTGIGQYSLAALGTIVLIGTISWEPLRGLAR